MTDENGSYAQFLLDEPYFDLHGLPQCAIERGHRLIKEQHRRTIDNGTGQRDTLLLAAGQVAHRFGSSVAELNGCQCLSDPAIDFGALDALLPQRKSNIVGDRKVGEQCV
ncbi:hypothetical protein A5784_08010 [Mycobacterium sp. 852013-50091_SCH5140682]|nr:hypothetical protein A5784_08010 [Mycobacterium sp. 852013-50091_SCH5140682]